MSNRTISWSAALRKLKADRLARPVIREERLRSSAHFPGAAPLALSVWRGRSGRRYVVVVQTLDTPDLVAERATVVLAVARDAEGHATIVAVRPCEAGDAGFLGWLAACAQLGACELHAHRLAETAAERAAIAADLGGPTGPVAAPAGGEPQ
jgi:hypothetical protein